MDPAAAFFFTVLSLQAVFAIAVTWLVARRFPARARLYRFVAPAALPLLLFALVAFAAAHDGAASLPVLARVFLSDAVLWLVGVLLASFVIRRVRR